MALAQHDTPTYPECRMRTATLSASSGQTDARPAFIDTERLVAKANPVPQIRTDLLSEAPAEVSAGDRYEELCRTQFDQPAAAIAAS
jgi:hypothetical protein